jgi:Ca2+/H+ antiporter
MTRAVAPSRSLQHRSHEPPGEPDMEATDFSPQTAMSSPTRSSTEMEHNAEPPPQLAEKQSKQFHDWDGANDPDHPKNWALWRKLTTTIMLASITFSISINSSIFASATKKVQAEFGISAEVATLGTSFYLLVLGPSCLNVSSAC